MTDRKPAKLEKTLYVATASATSGRDGRIKSDDAILDMPITPPKALGGSGAGTNPEQLFAAGYAACFGGALGVVARLKKVTTGPVTMTAKVSLGQVGQGYGIAVEMTAAIPNLPWIKPSIFSMRPIKSVLTPMPPETTSK